MKISRQKLNELIRHITRGVLKEFASLSPTKLDGTPNDGETTDDGVEPMTDAEKASAERKQTIDAKEKSKQAKIELDAGEKTYLADKAKADKWKSVAKKQAQEKVKQTTMAVANPAPITN